MDNEFIVVLVNIIIIFGYISIFVIWFKTNYHIIMTILLFIFMFGASIFTLYNLYLLKKTINTSNLNSSKLFENSMIYSVLLGHVSQFISLILIIISYFSIVNNKLDINNYDNQYILYIYKIIYIINAISVYLGYFLLNSINSTNVLITNNTEKYIKNISYAIPILVILISSGLLYFYSVHYYKKNYKVPSYHFNSNVILDTSFL